MPDEILTCQHLRDEIEALFPYSGSMDRQHMSPVWTGKISSRTYALRARGARAEVRLLTAMLEHFVQAKRALGNRTDVGVIWRREPFLVTEDDGQVILRMRAALVDSDGQIDVAGLPQKAEGVPSRSID
jgi:hypothetical protein